MASYDWIDIQTPDDYDRLIGVLDPEFEPKKISQRLKSEVTAAAKGVLLEHGYVDKDYRSTFYNFYAKKGRHYRADCVRLHFFDPAVGYDEARTDIYSTDGRPTRPLFRLHRTETDHCSHIGAISAFAEHSARRARESNPVGSPRQPAWSSTYCMGVSLNGPAR